MRKNEGKTIMKKLMFAMLAAVVAGVASAEVCIKSGDAIAFMGNRMMAWGVLKAMGVDESMKEKIFAEFARIPGACSVTVGVSADEYSILESKAKAAGKSVAEFAKDRLFK